VIAITNFAVSVFVAAAFRSGLDELREIVPDSSGEAADRLISANSRRERQ